MKRFKAGDEVRLLRNIGRLNAGAVGLVVEVYSQSPLGPDEETMDTLFDYAVVFPAEIEKLVSYQGQWLRTALNWDQFHAGDPIPVKEDELEACIEGVTPRLYGKIPREAMVVRWDANTGHDGANALARWVGGKFVFDEQHPEKTYYWSIEVETDRYIFRARPGQFLLRFLEGGVGCMDAATFVSTYASLEK